MCCGFLCAAKAQTLRKCEECLKYEASRKDKAESEKQYMKMILDRVRESAPLIHNITNYVTAGDVANMILACGAKPIMADDAGEVEEITALCSGLNINLGTSNQDTIQSMFLAGKKAQELGHALLLDPVGVGASRQRIRTALELIRQIHFDVIRGNSSEIKTIAAGLDFHPVMQSGSRELLAEAGTKLAGTGTRVQIQRAEGGHTRGVEASDSDVVTEETLNSMIGFVKELAGTLGCVIAMTGAIDLVADANQCYVIRSGRPEMGRITGTGCQLSGLMTSFLAANPQEKLKAAAAAVCAMGLAGEIGWSHMQPTDGNATYGRRIIDAVYHMTGEQLDAGARFELR